MGDSIRHMSGMNVGMMMCWRVPRGSVVVGHDPMYQGAALPCGGNSKIMMGLVISLFERGKVT